MPRRRTLLIAVAAFFAPIAVAGAPTLEAALIRDGATTSYPVPPETIKQTLAATLCTTPEGKQLKLSPDGAVGWKCDEEVREPVWVVTRMVTVIFGSQQQSKRLSAIRWAKVAPIGTGPAPITQVKIGATLYVDSQRVTTLDGHFFKPLPWAQGVWRALKAAH